MTTALYTFTDQQSVDIRRYCGYPAYGDGNVVFPYPWIMRQYLALEYRLQHMTVTEGSQVVTYLGNCSMLEAAIPGTSANLDTDQAAVWTHNKYEMRDRIKLYTWARRTLCNFLGIQPGPNFSAGGDGSMQMVV